MSTIFIVKNISPQRKKIRLFNYPLNPGETRDLLTIDYVSEAEIRRSLLPNGDLWRRIHYRDVEVVDSNIDLLQFDTEQKNFLYSSGVDEGLEIHTSAGTTILVKNHRTNLLTDKNSINVEGTGITASTHLGDDTQADITILTGDPQPLSIGTSGSEGITNALARADHIHAVFSPGPPTNVSKSTALPGASAAFAREDHKHDIATAAAGVVAIGDTGGEGSAATLARSDHSHTITAGLPVAIGTANATGAASTFARSDHIHQTTFDAVKSAISGSDSSISFNNQNLINVGEVNGNRYYGPLAADPVSPAPSSGDTYFNTAIGAPMEYDASRSKWLGVGVEGVYGGADGDTAAGSFFRGMDGLAFGTNRGIPVQKGTLTGILISMTANVSSSVEVLVDNTVIDTINVATAGLTTDLSLNTDFDQGLMKFRNISSGGTMSNVQITANYKRRA